LLVSGFYIFKVITKKPHIEDGEQEIEQVKECKNT
jgi:hypothetical protein